MNIKKFDIVVNNKNEILQYIGKEMEYGAIVQDIHCKTQLTHINLINRKANKDETKWFCENTENINFVTPNVA